MCHSSISGIGPSIGTFASVQRRSKFSALIVSASSSSAYALKRDWTSAALYGSVFLTLKVKLEFLEDKTR